MEKIKDAIKRCTEPVGKSGNIPVVLGEFVISMSALVVTILKDVHEIEDTEDAITALTGTGLLPLSFAIQYNVHLFLDWLMNEDAVIGDGEDEEGLWFDSEHIISKWNEFVDKGLFKRG